MRTIIAGSRGVNFNETVEGIESCPFKEQISVVISGTARGVDQNGEEWARLNNIPIEKYPANWDKFGKSAGYRRNVEMAEMADALIAIWDGVSKGTKHMIDIAKQKNLEVYIYIVT